jgi:DNA-binding MarR family transcriptional regulator
VGNTRWLSEDELAAWKSFAVLSRLLFAQLERDLQADTGMGFTAYMILVQLSEAPERRLRMSELADLGQYSRSAMSHAVARLEKLGWVTRPHCPTDRRGAFAEITDKGWAALEGAAPRHVESVRTHLIDRLSTDQLKQLRDLTDVLVSHLAPNEPRFREVLA